jgi:transposase
LIILKQMTYSPDFREKVLTIKQQEGLTQAEAAVRFRVGVASITRWGKRLESKRTRTKPATKIDMKVLEEDVKTHPDAYQYERAARLGVSQRAIGNALKRLGVSYKKNIVTSESGRKRTACLSGKNDRVYCALAISTDNTINPCACASCSKSSSKRVCPCP